MTELEPLKAVRNDIGVQCRIAREAGDWWEEKLLEWLYEVADIVRRIADRTEAYHYGAEEGGRLVIAALNVRRAALERVIDGDEEDRKLAEALQLEKNVDEQINRVMWMLADRRSVDENNQLNRSQALELLDAVGELHVWAENIAFTALP